MGVIFYANNFYHSNADGNFKIRKDEKPMKDYKKIIYLTAAVCLLGTAAFCGYHIYDHYAHEAEQAEAFEEIGLYNKSWGKEQKRRTKQAQSGKMKVQESTT